MEKTTLHPFDRVMGWLLPAIVGLTPFIIIYVLIRPNTGQAYFFQTATLLATAALGVAWMLGWRPLPWPITTPPWLLFAAAAGLIGSLAVSPEPVYSLKMSLLPVCGFLFWGALISYPRRRRLLRRIGVITIILGALLSIYGLLEQFGFEFLTYSEQVQKNRVVATIGHPNYLASVLGPVLFITLAMTFSWKKRLAWILGGLLVFLTLFCITVARTRGVWLGLLLGTLTLALMGSRYSIRQRLGWRFGGTVVLSSLLALVALAVAVFVVLPAFDAGIDPNDLRERVLSDTEIKSRMFYWRAAADMGTERPVFGQGYAMFNPRFWDYTLQQQKTKWAPYYADIIPAISGRNPDHVHNEYLEIFAEQGLAGFLPLAAFILFFVWFGYLSIMRQREPARALEGVAIYSALLTILVDALFGFPWRLPVSLIVFMVVLAWLYDFIYPQEDL